MIQPPVVNFVTSWMIETSPVATAPMPLSHAFHRQPGFLGLAPVHDHPGLREREADEHADGVQRHQRIRVSVEQPDEQQRHEREAHDAVRERQPVAARRELPRHVAIVGEDAGESRKIGERRVGREHEHGERRVLERVVQRPAAEHVMAENREHRLARRRHDVIVLREKRHAEEERGEDRHHPAECRRGILLRRRLEGHHAIRDRLGARHRGAALGEAAHQEIREREARHRRHPAALRARRNWIDLQRGLERGELVAREISVESDTEQREHHPDERVRRQRERGAGLSHASQVDHREQHDGQRADEHRVRRERRIRRRDRGHAARDRHGDGEDVVGEQRRRRDESRHDAEVLARDGVGAAAVRVREYRLPIREADEHEQPDDDRRDPEDIVDRGESDGAAEHEQDLIGRVRDRGNRVGRENGERGLLVQPLVLQPFAGERA